jgi:hypothetical protein
MAFAGEGQETYTPYLEVPGSPSYEVGMASANQACSIVIGRTTPCSWLLYLLSS